MAETTSTAKPRPYWLPDIQGFLALGILLFVFLAFIVLIFGPQALKGEVLSVVTVVIGVLTGSLKDVYSYYFPGSKDLSGNSDAIRAIATSQNAPASTVPVPPWWSRLDDNEKNKITAAASNDPRVAAFITAAQVGAANAADLAYLVTVGLLTQDRATAIQTTP